MVSVNNKRKQRCIFFVYCIYYMLSKHLLSLRKINRQYNLRTIEVI